MQSGLPKETIADICSVFSRHHCIRKALLYGSRAMGTHKNGSDIDITLEGQGLDLAGLNKIRQDIDDLLLPYAVDLSIFSHIQNDELVQHIQRVGVVFYESAE